MMICKKELFDKYYSFVFDVLFKTEKEIHKDVLTRDNYQQRVYGFLSERLMNIFIEYKKRTAGLKVKELPILYREENPIKYARLKLKKIL